MLHKLINIKKNLITWYIYPKLNLFLPKINKIKIINSLVIIYTNLMNNSVKIIPPKYNYTNSKIFFWKIFAIFYIIESMLFFII